MAKLKTVGVDIPVEMRGCSGFSAPALKPGKPQGPPRIVATVGTDYLAGEADRKCQACPSPAGHQHSHRT